MLAFTVEGEPVSWKRARRANGHSYTDPQAAAHMEKIRAAARNAGFRGPALATPFRLYCRFFRDMDPWDQRFGDRDNLEKIIKDALNGVVWVDDRWVVFGESGKARHPTPCTEVRIEWNEHGEERERIAAQKPADFRKVLAPKALEKLNRKRMQPARRDYRG